MQTLSENVDEAFRLLGLALSHPRFEADAVERMRVELLAGLKQEEEEPANIAAKAWFKAYFGTHPYAHSEDGTADGIQAIAIPDIKSFATTHLVRGGAKVAVAGDISEDALTKQIAATFGPLAPDAPLPTPEPQKVGAPGTSVLPMDVPQPAAVFGLPGPLRPDPMFMPAYVANYIFGGGGLSSRLMDQVRDKRGLTYDISTDLGDYRAAGILVGEVASDKTKIDDALEVTKKVMADFAAKGATANELADAKTYLTGSFPLHFDSTVKIANTLNSFSARWPGRRLRGQAQRAYRRGDARAGEQGGEEIFQTNAAHYRGCGHAGEGAAGRHAVEAAAALATGNRQAAHALSKFQNSRNAPLRA